MNKDVLLKVWRLANYRCGKGKAPDNWTVNVTVVNPTIQEGNFRWKLIGKDFEVLHNDNAVTRERAVTEAQEHADAMGLNIVRALEFEDDDMPRDQRIATLDRNDAAEEAFRAAQ